MTLSEYFDGKRGIGVLSTADKEGKVDAAIYATPHIGADGSISFLMRDRLTHHNLQSNPHAAYLFVESGGGYRGIRIYLTKTAEETDSDLIAKMTRRHLTPEEDAQKGPKFLVHFTVDKILPLIGSDDPGISVR